MGAAGGKAEGSVLEPNNKKNNTQPSAGEIRRECASVCCGKSRDKKRVKCLSRFVYSFFALWPSQVGAPNVCVCLRECIFIPKNSQNGNRSSG